MAEVVPEKSRGLKFAEQQLLRHGWEQGKGLGRAENGICEAIKVKVKCDKGGVGHREGDQFTFQWWDHVFNKASASLQVESDQNGVTLKKTVEEGEEEGMISNKRPRKAALARDKLYGCFVKSDTLLSGHKQPALKSSDSSDDSSSSEDEEDKKLDLSSTFDLSDAALMKACGGRTGHKGARHGLTMNAKLARLEQQEAEFMEKYGKKKNQPATASPTPQTVQTTSTGSSNELNADTVSESPETDVKPKKKKKEKKKKTKEDAEVMTEAVSNDGETICVENSEADPKTKRKHKKKRKEVDEVAPTPAAESKSPEGTGELHSDTKTKKKKKKKKKKSSEKHSAEEDKSNDTESSQSEPLQDCVPKTKKKKSAATEEQADIAEVSTVKQKRKKCKKDKTSMEDDVNEEALPPPKKKKKTKCKE